MLLSSLHEAYTDLWKQDLADSINDTVVVRVEVNRELRAIQRASLSVAFIKDILIFATKGGGCTGDKKLLEQ